MNPFRVLLYPSGSRTRYVVRAWLVGTLPSLFILPIMVAIVERFRPVELPEFDDTRLNMIFAVLVAPILETLLMLAVWYGLRRLIGGAQPLRIALLAAVFALSHYWAGGWWHVVGVAWLALVLSTALTVWSDKRVRDGFVIAAAVHAMANITVLVVFNALGGG
jgi:riboflavin transporter FmnP